MNKSSAALKTVEPPVEGPAPKTIMKPINELYLAAEAPKGHNLTIRDSGRGSPMTDAELKASIYAKGIIYPLMFKRVDGKAYVIAGNRRLRFLREIFADALDSPVQTQDVDDFEGDWREVAGDTNLTLPPHLVERYELIVALSKDLKLSPEDARLRFGMTPRQYAQVMALGKMSPTIRKAWRDGEIDAKIAQVFTLESDPKEQDKIYETAKKQAHNGRVSDFDIRRRIVPENQREAGRLVAFVGVDACKKAKIIKQEDLFSTSHLVTDVRALHKLAGDKLAEWCTRLTAETAEGGWAWAIPENKAQGPTYNYGTLNPAGKTQPTTEEKTRLEELKVLQQDDDTDDFEELGEEEERILEAIKGRGFSPEQRAKSGCFLKVGHDGSLVIEYGKVKPAERRSVEASDRRANAPSKAKAKKPGVVTLTNAGAERLSEQLEKAVSSSLSATPHVAVAALIAGFASDGHVINVSVEGGEHARFGRSSGAVDERNFVQVFEGAVSASSESRVIMLTKVAVEAISIQIRSAEAKPPIEDKGLQALIAKMDPKALNKAIAESFDAKSYFDGVSLQACVDAVRCSLGDDNAAKVAKMKKGEAAKFATTNLPPKGWLPRELRTVHYKGPVEKTAAVKPPAKKKVAKKAAKKAKK